MTRACIVTLVAGTLVGLVAPPRVDGALCRTRRGAVFLRDACKRKEAPLQLLGLGAAGPKGDPGPRGASRPRLRAFDATGTPLPGHVTGLGDVVIPRGSRAVRVRAGSNGFQPSESFYFEAMSCAGQRLVLDEGTLVEQATIVGTTAYYAGDPVQDLLVGSQLYPDTAQRCAANGGTYDAGIGFCCVSAGGTRRVGPAAPIDLGTFAPPFRVELVR
jgi:hypothetical protein